MTPQGSNEPQPIIIVRRRRMEDDGHHGGAWKIAFADFMTAMMALFLVLWLVNASDADTRKAVASYFNPVKLVDRERSRRGLATPGTEQDVDGEGEAEAAPPAQAAVASTAPSREGEEARFLGSPDAVLDAREKEALAAGEAVAAGEAGEAVAAGEAFAAGEVAGSGTAAIETSLAAELRPADPYALDVTGPADPPVVPAPRMETEPETEIGKPEEEPRPEEEPKPEEEAKPEGEPKLEEEIASSIQDAIRDALPQDAALADAVKVTQVEGGTLIQLTDGPGYAMFDTGSFLPTGRTVVAVKAIAAVLAAREGGVRIEGHTDAVPFTGDGDNWRLSTERAHAARLMLARGGLGLDRVRQVAGFAASRPLDGTAPEDPRNRRIAILLERS